MKQSMYSPYYNKIQGLLFEGMAICEVHEYMKQFFGIYADYNTFLWYVRKHKLKWYMPVRIR